MLGAHILLVEDDEILCEIIERNLRARGHQVWIAHDAQSAVAYLRAQAFDLVVLDINLPDQTGWDVLRAARSEGLLGPGAPGGKLPVVVLSAVHISPARLAEFNPLAYLPKPFPLDALLRLATEAQHRRTGPLPVHKEELHA